LAQTAPDNLTILPFIVFRVEDTARIQLARTYLRDRPPLNPQNLNYNTPGGKLNRGMSVVDTVEILKGRQLSEDEYFKAAVLGWCVELVREVA
jgi:ATP-dependent protease ClpP protease subunit